MKLSKHQKLQRRKAKEAAIREAELRRLQVREGAVQACMSCCGSSRKVS